eukprot:Opistho-2@88772
MSVSGIDLVALVPVALAALIAAGVAVLWWTAPRPRPRADSEQSYSDPATGRRTLFPSLFEDPTVDLSLVVPAYNEQERLPVMLDETIEYLERRSTRVKNFSWEIIIVNDGSRDGTSAVAGKYVSRLGASKVRLLEAERNRGKGGAVKLGMLSARGRLLLMVDADGATKISDLEKLLAAMAKLDKAKGAVVIGSRAHLQDEAVAQRTVLRNILMYGFHVLVQLCVRGIRDTQCGFKLFDRRAARLLFPAMHVERWCFDIELLFLARLHGMPIGEVSVNWQEIPGSKLSPLSSSVQMAKDLVLIRLYYLFGVWSHRPRAKRD